MLGTAVIVFREVLEAALLIGIIAAATRDVPGRSRWLAAGVVMGLIAAGVVAASAEKLSEWADGVGQELFNAGVLGVAVIMLAWHNIWMTRHAKELSANAKSVGLEIRDGVRECSVLAVVVGLAVLREGSETVLFLYGIALSEAGHASSMLLGGILGSLAGVALGVLIYVGLLRVPLRLFFGATATLVLLLAAGMASQAARNLIQADLLPGLATPLWDTSGLVPQDSLLGLLLKSLLGYDARPAGMQVIFYCSVLTLIWFGMKWAARGLSRPALKGA